MTPPNPLTELAERVSRLTVSRRETDCLIFETRHRLLTPERRGTIDGEPTGEYFDLDGNVLPERAPFYTSSLDAAMTLVPEGWDYCLSVGAGEPACAAMSPAGQVSDVSVTAATPALALTAASLRARAASENSHG